MRLWWPRIRLTQPIHHLACWYHLSMSGPTQSQNYSFGPDNMLWKHRPYRIFPVLYRFRRFCLMLLPSDNRILHHGPSGLLCLVWNSRYYSFLHSRCCWMCCHMEQYAPVCTSCRWAWLAWNCSLWPPAGPPGRLFYIVCLNSYPCLHRRYNRTDTMSNHRYLHRPLWFHRHIPRCHNIK